jgi:regulation of enolase protein 1 (concanavalin A-like superfamily)
MDLPIGLSALPMPLRWGARPARWDTDGRSHLQITAGPKSDIFIDPAGGGTWLGAPRLLGAPPDGDFQFSARVGVGFATNFDAGSLLVWADEQRWAKLCFEFSAARQPMIISAVTRRSSDDASAFAIDGPTAWLRISRLGRALAFHASADGTEWQIVRYFDLGAEAVLIGFSAQSPHGEGCTAVFEDIAFQPRRLAELHDGR